MNSLTISKAHTIHNLIVFVVGVLALPWLGWGLDVGRGADPHNHKIASAGCSSLSRPWWCRCFYALWVGRAGRTWASSRPSKAIESGTPFPSSFTRSSPF